MAKHYPSFIRNSRDESGPLSSASAGGQSRLPLRREVISVEDDLSISNILFLLLEELDYEGEEALLGREALAAVEREDFDSILLDVRCLQFPLRECPLEITQLEPSLIGRVLAVTIEVVHPDILELLARHCVFHLPRSPIMDKVMDDLHRWLRRLHVSFGDQPR